MASTPSQWQRLVIKVGTNVLAQTDGRLDITNISSLVDQIAALHQAGKRVVLVSSGAVGAGRTLTDLPATTSKVVKRQVWSAIGQVRLMEIYRQLLANHGLCCAQVLATKEDFRDRQHYLNMQNCFGALLRDGIVPVVNENDVTSISELMFTDNDELAGMVAGMVNADALLLLSSVDGLYNGPPSQADSQLIPLVSADDKDWASGISDQRSSFGRGGMGTKMRIAARCAKMGIATYIANGRHPHVIEQICAGQAVGTRFEPQPRLSPVKKWLAQQADDHKGIITINAGAIDALRDPDTSNSLLPVGVIHIEEAYDKGDLLSIIDEKGRRIALGLAHTDSNSARSSMGQQGQKPVVHYDYLVLEES